MPAKCPRLEEAFLGSPVVDFDGYPYFVNPLSDGIPRVDRDLLVEVADAMIGMADLDCELILAPEAMGIPLAVLITERTGIPFAVIRKREYGLPGEIALNHVTGYSGSPMYINGVSPGDRVAIVDDVVSTGGTLRAVVGSLRSAGAVVTEVVTVFSKCRDMDGLSSELGIPVRSLVSVSSEGGRPRILRSD